MLYVLREADERSQEHVEEKFREDGYVYFSRTTDSSDKLDRMPEGDFDRKYIRESELRLEEGT